MSLIAQIMSRFFLCTRARVADRTSKVWLLSMHWYIKRSRLIIYVMRYTDLCLFYKGSTYISTYLFYDFMALCPFQIRPMLHFKLWRWLWWRCYHNLDIITIMFKVLISMQTFVAWQQFWCLEELHCLVEKEDHLVQKMFSFYVSVSLDCKI